MGIDLEPQTNAQYRPPGTLDSLSISYQPMLFLMLAAATLLSFYHLSGGAGFEPTDCWVAQTAREMSEVPGWRGWIVPRFSGETRLQKSPGPYWAVMTISQILGRPIDEVTARIPNGLAAITLVITVVWLTRHIAGQRAALYAGFALTASGLVLYWSHRGASDLGLAALTSVSLAFVYAAATEERATRRGWLWLAAYFTAGLGMLYKLPMPVVCVGLPALAFVLFTGRWRLLLSGWHLIGLALFCVPWVPWAATVIMTEPTAVYKWRTEFIDRFTGNLPNVEQNKHWEFFFLYPITALIYCLPFSLSLPGALRRAVRSDESIDRSGRVFLLCWFLSHLAFFTAATGKETRYFLPAMPPLFVLLGVELAHFFDPLRERNERWQRLGFTALLVGLPVAMVAVFFGLRTWYRQIGQIEGTEWSAVIWPFGVTCAILGTGVVICAVLYRRGAGNAAFGALVATVWGTWLWIWPNLMPILVSQKPFRDFAAQMNARIPRDYDPVIRQIGTQDSRIIWYGDRRFPRIIDQLELLRLQGGQRSLKREMMFIGEEMVKQLRSEQLVLMVIHRFDFIEFKLRGPEELAKRGEEMPPIHLWLQARFGGAARQFLVFGNQPPPWPEPALDPPSERMERQSIRDAALRSHHEELAPATQPAPTRSPARGK